MYVNGLLNLSQAVIRLLLRNAAAMSWRTDVTPFFRKGKLVDDGQFPIERSQSEAKLPTTSMEFFNPPLPRGRIAGFPMGSGL